MTQTRQSHLDALRGLAAFIVVINHYLAAFYPYSVFGEPYQQHTAIESISFIPPFGILSAGNFSVCLFFILSGYVLSYSYVGENRNLPRLLSAIVKRPIRLGGLVFSSSVVGFILWYFGLLFNYSIVEITHSDPWFNGFWSGEAEIDTFFYNLTTSIFSDGKTYNPPLWTIGIELYGSIMVYLFLMLWGGNKYRIALLLAVIIFFRDNLYQGFFLGVLFADLVKNHDLIKRLTNIDKYFYVWVCVILYLVSYPHYITEDFRQVTLFFYLPNDAGFGGGYTMLSALIVFTLSIVSQKLQDILRLPIFQYLGKISYAVYVVHFLILGSLSSWMFEILVSQLDYHAAFFVVIGVSFPLIIYFSHLLTLYIDYPTIKLSNKVGKGVYHQISSRRRK